jgi:hypothetical protein
LLSIVVHCVGIGEFIVVLVPGGTPCGVHCDLVVVVVPLEEGVLHNGLFLDCAVVGDLVAKGFLHYTHVNRIEEKSPRDVHVTAFSVVKIIL